MTAAQMRAMALALPGVEEKSHFQHPDFRVRNKIFATLWPEQRRSVLRLTLAEQFALLKQDAETFSVRGSPRYGWTGVKLERVDKEQFRGLLVEAWRGVASKELLEAYETKSPKARPRKRVGD